MTGTSPSVALLSQPTCLSLDEGAEYPEFLTSFDHTTWRCHAGSGAAGGYQDGDEQGGVSGATNEQDVITTPVGPRTPVECDGGGAPCCVDVRTPVSPKTPVLSQVSGSLWDDSLASLRDLEKVGTVRLHNEWRAEVNNCGTYRYLHYSAYDYNHRKILEGETEAIYAGHCGCGTGCSPLAVQIRVRNTALNDVILIKLTGNVNKHPIDGAEIQSGEGQPLAIVTWKRPRFEVTDVDGRPWFYLRLIQCFLCSNRQEHIIYSARQHHSLGSVVLDFKTWMDQISGDGVLTTQVPLQMDLPRKAAWVSLLFLVKLVYKGKEYPREVSIDSGLNVPYDH